MNQKESQKDQFGHCQQRSQCVKMGGIAIEGILAPVDGQVACQMGCQKTAEAKPRDRHHQFFPDG